MLRYVTLEEKWIVGTRNNIEDATTTSSNSNLGHSEVPNGINDKYSNHIHNCQPLKSKSNQPHWTYFSKDSINVKVYSKIWLINNFRRGYNVVPDD